MTTWAKRIRGAIGMGLTWAIVWAPVAVVVGTQIIDPTDAMDEMWLMVGALPGFISGVIFSIVLSNVARRRRLEDLSVIRTGMWGALAGLLTGIIPFVLGDRGGESMVPLAAIILPTLTLLSAFSAAGSLALAQRALKRESLAAGTTANDSHLDHEPTRSVGAGIPHRAVEIKHPINVRNDPPTR